MKTVIVSGGLGVGKSTLARILMVHGALIIEVDDLVRSYFESDEKGKALYQQLCSVCQLKKEKLKVINLREELFKSLEAQSLLKEKLLPSLICLIEKELTEKKNYPYVIIVLPIWPKEYLSFYKYFSKQIILITCQKNTQLERLKCREGESAINSDAVIEMGNRWVLEGKKSAMTLFENNGNLDDFIDFAKRLDKELRQ